MKVVSLTIVLLSVFFLFIGCSESTPSCIEDMIEEFTSQNQDQSFTFIYTFEQAGNQYYIFDNGIAFDAIATVLDENCTVVCSYGGFRANNPDPCDEFGDAINNAEQIWPE